VRCLHTVLTCARSIYRLYSVCEDSVQTPGYPHGDGDCAPPGCDVGKTLPIGAYLFNPAAANTSVNGQVRKRSL
jgi:hypothetical protein